MHSSTEVVLIHVHLLVQLLHYVSNGITVSALKLQLHAWKCNMVRVTMYHVPFISFSCLLFKVCMTRNNMKTKLFIVKNVVCRRIP